MIKLVALFLLIAIAIIVKQMIDNKRLETKLLAMEHELKAEIDDKINEQNKQMHYEIYELRSEVARMIEPPKYKVGQTFYAKIKGEKGISVIEIIKEKYSICGYIYSIKFRNGEVRDFVFEDNIQPMRKKKANG